MHPLVLSRLATKIGDHAWDLALPLIIIRLFPESLSYVAAYYLIKLIGKILLLPRLGAWMGQKERWHSAQFALWLQLVGIGIVGLGFLGISIWRIPSLLWLAAVFDILAAAGSALMYAAVVSDWTPTLFASQELSSINSQIKRVDLMTECLAPIGAGLVMALTMGFWIIWAFNLFSFIVEYGILKRLQERASERLRKKSFATQGPHINIISAIGQVKAQPAACFIGALACLWFTILTPHGAVLSGFLNKEWHFSEGNIGLIRGLGALAGIMPTFFFTRLEKHFGLIGASRLLISFQAICLLIIGYSFFYFPSPLVFVVFLLLSRIGLYGFILGEVQLRQLTVSESARMEVAAAAAMINNCAALGVYVLSLVYSDFSEFGVLICGSTLAVTLGAVLAWQQKDLQYVR